MLEQNPTGAGTKGYLRGLKVENAATSPHLEQKPDHRPPETLPAGLDGGCRAVFGGLPGVENAFNSPRKPYRPVITSGAWSFLGVGRRWKT